MVFERLSPRQRGLIGLVGSALCIGLNLFTIVSWGEYYRLLFPFAFAMVPPALFQLSTGATPDDIRAGRFPRATKAMLVLMVVGGALGFVANHAIR